MPEHGSIKDAFSFHTDPVERLHYLPAYCPAPVTPPATGEEGIVSARICIW